MRKGYKWLPKSQKRLYDKETREARVAFARRVLSLTKAQLREKLSMAMDGVILAMPPRDPTDRFNFCRCGDDHIWRKHNESLSPLLAGADEYGKQVPMARAVPMWGGCSEGGFSIILFHATKKITKAEWRAAVTAGKLKNAILKLDPVKAEGPWHVICDNESFLRAKDSNATHKEANVKLWKIPKHSPDLNPAERFWSWMRKKL
eukprot:6348461-Karenia_brevis.AAC.1